jgi:hypothetical protein
MKLTPEIKKIIRFFREKMHIDLKTAPCFSCEAEKRGFPCSNPKECELLNKWIENLEVAPID